MFKELVTEKKIDLLKEPIEQKIELQTKQYYEQRKQIHELIELNYTCSSRLDN